MLKYLNDPFASAASEYLPQAHEHARNLVAARRCESSHLQVFASDPKGEQVHEIGVSFILNPESSIKPLDTRYAQHITELDAKIFDCSLKQYAMYHTHEAAFDFQDIIDAGLVSAPESAIVLAAQMEKIEAALLADENLMRDEITQYAQVVADHCDPTHWVVQGAFEAVETSAEEQRITPDVLRLYRATKSVDEEEEAKSSARPQSVQSDHFDLFEPDLPPTTDLPFASAIRNAFHTALNA